MAIPTATEAAKITTRTIGYLRKIRSPVDRFTPVTKNVCIGPLSQLGVLML